MTQNSEEDTEMKTAVLITVLMVVAVCVAPAYCQGGPGGPGGPPPPPPRAVQPPPPADRIDDIATNLGLTSDQATALKAVLVTADTTVRPLIDAAIAADKALHKAFVAADFDSATSLANDATDAELALTKASLAAWAQIQASGILTADQFTKLLAGRGPGGPPPGGDQSGSGSSSTKGRRNGR